jgi:hypothetical protein
MTDPEILFFVHIPKSGGTSFRKAAEHFFGKDGIVYDYGKDSPHTSDVILEYCYKNNDLYGLSKALSKSSVKMIAGHMPAFKFSRIVGIGNTISFVRDPAEQLISHFRHFKRQFGYPGSFEKFANRPDLNSLQSRLLRQVPIESLGFIGLTEHFQTSVELFNEKFGVDLHELTLNVADRKEDEKTIITEEMRAIAIENTREERVFYDRILNLFSKRKMAQKLGHVFVHGTVSKITSRRISGFAFVPGSDNAVQLHLDLNGKRASEPKPARSFRPNLAAYKVERNGFVGFDFKVPRLAAGDRISCIATETGQVLWEAISPIVEVGKSGGHR